MHIPMTRDEIAELLEIAPQQVDQLWQRGLLQRSLHCAHRPIPELSYSTVYDVLEFALAAGVLEVRLSRELAALWVAQLAEADEWEDYRSAPFERRIKMMLEIAEEDGLNIMTRHAWKVVAVLLKTQDRLLGQWCLTSALMGPFRSI